MTQKLYPFNAERNAHDIAFRRNRAMNEMSDKEANGTLTDKERREYERFIEESGNILEKCVFRDYRGIVWLTGKEIGMAKECMAWASVMRG